MNISRFSCFSLSIAMLVLLTGSAEAKRYALVVGVNKYINSSNLEALSYAENDAEKLGEALRTGKFDEVTVMTNGIAEEPRHDHLRPGMNNVLREIDRVLSKAKYPEDVVVVAFAGHGVQFEFKEESTLIPKFYFCPQDADLINSQTLEILENANDIKYGNKLIELGAVFKKIKECKAGSKLLLVDACRNDPSKVQGLRAARQIAQARGARGKIKRDFSFRTLPKLPETPGGTAAFFSCSKDQFAYEHDDLGHGVFFHHVIAALKGGAANRDGEVTLLGLADYVHSRTPRWVQENFVANGAEVPKQNPLFETKLSKNPTLTYVSTEAMSGYRKPIVKLPDVSREVEPAAPLVRTPNPVLAIGKQYLAKKQYEAAITSYSNVVATSTDAESRKEALLGRGKAYLERGTKSDIDKALLDYKEAGERGITMTVLAESAQARVERDVKGTVKKGQKVLISVVDGEYLWVVSAGDDSIKGYITKADVMPQPVVVPRPTPKPAQPVTVEPLVVSRPSPQPAPTTFAGRGVGSQTPSFQSTPSHQSFHQPSQQTFRQPSQQTFRQPSQQTFRQPSQQTFRQPSRQGSTSGTYTSGGSANDRFIDNWKRKNGGRPPGAWQTPRWESPAEVRRLRAQGRLR